MAKQFDTTLKELFNIYPNDFLSLLRLTGQAPVIHLPTNLTANIDTDMVLGLGQPLRGVIDVNFQVEWDDQTPARMLSYNVMLWRVHGVAVHSILVMLRSRGSDLRLDSELRYSVFPERGYTAFQPEVIRLWERPVEELLTGGLGLLPLASLAAMPDGLTREEAMPDILRRIALRLREESSSERTDRLINWTYQLAGLHFSPNEVRAMFRRSERMWSDILQKSATYQGLLQEGRLEAAHDFLLSLGQDKFGEPDETTKVTITEMNDLAHLKRLARAVSRASSWAELLQTK